MQIFSLLYLGAFLLTATSALLFGGFNQLKITPFQIWTLLYLGVVASGIGFFMWNHAARRVETGTLAVFNNLKVPLAVAVSLIFFGEQADLLHLLVGGGVVLIGLALSEALSARRNAGAEKLAESPQVES